MKEQHEPAQEAFGEAMTNVAKEQLGLDGRYRVYAVATDQIDEIDLDSLGDIDDLHQHCSTVKLPAGLARVSLAPLVDGRWRLEEAVHGIVNYGDPARKTIQADATTTGHWVHLGSADREH
ncbi:hypothetical protein [Halomonas faecis]|uniref:hypothetical protein n=1 Tax=Halomonas faecis TaxID=1562110 RepID=UPI0013D30148|nr:hypothetical protein [Halomonas faecis]